jgi:hypothetical protein
MTQNAGSMPEDGPIAPFVRNRGPFFLEKTVIFSQQAACGLRTSD